MLQIFTHTLGQLSTNCYLVTDTENNKTIIIDPADDGNFISETILRDRLEPIGIILTHGHYDHLLAVLELKLNFNIPIFLHKEDEFIYKKSHTSATHFSETSVFKNPPIDHFLEDNEIIKISDASLTVIHTPGHTPGSICLFSNPDKGDPILFTGDTLFSTGVGRTDLSYSDSKKLQKSIKKLATLPQNTLVYPGHEDYGFYLSNLDFLPQS